MKAYFVSWILEGNILVETITCDPQSMRDLMERIKEYSEGISALTEIEEIDISEDKEAQKFFKRYNGSALLVSSSAITVN